jgi:hypothetical protein
MKAAARIRTLLAVFSLATAHAADTAKSAASPDEGLLVLENELLRVAVSPVGARVVSLFDKTRQREAVKNLPYVGGINQVRYGAVLNLEETRDRFALTLTKLPDGLQKLTATAQVRSTDDKPGTATVTKEYLLAPGSSCLRLGLEVRNEGAEELGLIPWVRNLLLRGTTEQPEEAHMTEHGAFLSGKPHPGARDKAPVRGDPHYFPAANWSSRVVLPLDATANTLVAVTRPEDMFKLYNWHRGKEDFGTLEVIAQPFFAKPGASFRWDYALLCAPPVRNIAYASTELVIGVSPHPTWLTPETKELTLEFTAARELPGMKVRARLVAANDPDKALQNFDFALPGLSPRGIMPQKLAVNLQDGGAYHLRLAFTRDGQPFAPDALSPEQREVIIPLVVGQHVQAPVVFAKQTQAQGRLRRIEPQVRPARLAYACEAFEAFAFPAGQRCFRGDTFQATDKGPLQLTACAGEYESLQLVLMPKTKSETALAVAGSELTGPDGAKVRCESINDFLYAPTQTPSSYNALFPVGDYPEALLPVQRTTLKPQGNHPLFITWRVPRDARPGTYRGTVTLIADATRHEVPVEMKVWNIQLPLRGRWMEFASSLKGAGLGEARHADGTPFTRDEQRDAIVDMHLKYRLTPCDSGISTTLLKGDFPAFEKEMRKFVEGGATKIYLGDIPSLLKSHAAKMPEIEKYLGAKGWTDYFYVRPGFDEASIDLVPQIAAVCREWKKVSRVPIMETYYHDERADELYGLLDIWSRSYPAGGVPAWCRERMKAGDRFWKVNAMPGIMEGEPWVSGRRRYVDLWDLRVTGSYNWTVKNWTGVTKWGEDYWCDGGVGNLSAVLMWPHETGILSTIRLEAMRDGLEDNALLWMLREKVESLAGKTPSSPAHAAALEKARALCNDGPLAAKISTLEDLLRIRTEAGDTLSILNTP